MPRLRDKVALLTAGLSEKDRQCRHLMDLLRSKNSEWKRIKSELVLRRDGGTGSGCAKAAAADISAVLDDDNHEDGDEDSLNDCTQLPASQSQIHSQSNLDALVSLISETESEGPEIVIEAAASRPPPAASSARKRKSHARGCACCEKVKIILVQLCCISPLILFIIIIIILLLLVLLGYAVGVGFAQFHIS